MRYDPNESTFPPTGEQIRVTIGQCEEKVSAKGKDMLLMNIIVDEGQPGQGYETKFYALSFHVGSIMRAVGMDATGPREVDALTFRDKSAVVTFKQEPYVNRDGDNKLATKVDRWIPKGEVTVPVPDDDTPPPPSAEDEPAPVVGNDDDIPW